jgi:hypothetical protein
MAIDDTIRALTKIYQSIDRGIPKTAASPVALVNHLNDLYSESGEDLSSRELFTYDNVGSPSITVTLDIDVEFNPRSVMDNLRKKLHAEHCSETDEIGRTGTVWSCGRYDFVHDDDLGQLRISHQYSYRRRDTQSVLSIIKRMIGYAKDYLEEVKRSAEESAGTVETE